VANTDSQNRDAMMKILAPVLASKERVEALLPFSSTPKRPRGPEGKVTEGVWQTKRLHRPLALTDRKLYVFDAGRTPYARGVHEGFPRSAVHVVDVVDRRFGQRDVLLAIDGLGTVPFETGKLDDLDILLASLPAAESRST